MSEEETFGNLLLQKEANKPDPRIPNENEKKKLKEIYSYLRSSELKNAVHALSYTDLNRNDLFFRSIPCSSIFNYYVCNPDAHGYTLFDV